MQGCLLRLTQLRAKSGKSFQYEGEHITVSQALFFPQDSPPDVADLLANSCFLTHHILRLPGKTLI